MTIQWVHSACGNPLLQMAKVEARNATQASATPQGPSPVMQATALGLARSYVRSQELPDKIGKHSKRVDTALPGRHTKQLYKGWTWKEASILAQLMTGMARLNGYLVHVNAADTELCDCGRAKETVEHFLFHCRKWTDYRREMLACTQERRGNLSFYLGGKALSDGEK